MLHTKLLMAKIRRADLLISQAKERIAAQRRLTCHLINRGKDAEQAKAVLRAMEDSLAHMETLRSSLLRWLEDED
jgi:hypothetical protein